MRAVSAGLALAVAVAGGSIAQESVRVAEARGVVLRGLDKMSGDVRDIVLSVGETQAMGRLQVTLGECRFLESNPSGNAFAYLVVREAGREAPTFAGWMVAASPALNGLEHARYDIWVLRCSS